MSDAHSNCWLVPLRGHEFDLEDLPVYLHGAQAQAVKRDGIYYLVLPFTTSGASYEPIRDIAFETVARLNGAMTLLTQAHWPVEVAQAAFFALDERGVIAHTVVPVGTAHERNKAGQLGVTVNGVAQSDPRSGRAASLLAAASRKPALADALALIGRASPTWAELYLVFELVESNIGGKMFENGWISAVDEKQFSQTVNSYTALGRHGRHGKNRGSPPAVALNHGQAIKLMRALVLGWAQSVASEQANAA
jgi:hypothetical protein